MPTNAVKKMPAALIVNTRSRRGAALFEKALKMLQAESFNLVAVHPVRNPSELIQTVEQALGDGAELIILGSGDGTVSEVVDSLAHHKAVLGFLPLGTTNNFARSLGLPLSIEGAIKTLHTGKVMRVGLGQANDDYFANVSAIGLSVAIASMVTNKQKRLLGRLAYAITGIRAILRQRPFRAELKTAEGNIKSISAWQIVVANGTFHAGRRLSKRAHIAKETLVVYIVEGATRFQLLIALFGYWLNIDNRLRHVTYFETRSIRITADPVQSIEIDGELKASTPVRVSLAPGALKVIVPNHFTEVTSGKK